MTVQRIVKARRLRLNKQDECKVFSRIRVTLPPALYEQHEAAAEAYEELQGR